MQQVCLSAGEKGRMGPDRLVLVQVCLLEVAELGLQVLEVLCDALVLLCQPHVGLCILLLVLGVALLQACNSVIKEVGKSSSSSSSRESKPLYERMRGSHAPAEGHASAAAACTIQM